MATTEEKKSKMTDDEKTTFLDTMRKRREIGETAEAHNRQRAIEVTDFIYPTEKRGQWPQSLFDEREKRGMPSLTLNRLPAFINQVTGDQLSNRPQIKVRPAGLKSDQKGATDREGIIRQSEQASRAKFIIDQAYKTMYVSGFDAHWQINTRYVAEDSFDQEIVWEAIEDQFSVITDPYAKENDRRDANWKFILETISEDEFKRRYPDKEIPTSADGVSQFSNWFNPGKDVTLAIYWTRKSRKRTLCALPSGATAWKDELPKELLDEIAARGITLRERETDDWTTEVSVCSGTDILEEPKEKPWRWIPVVDLIPPYIMKEGKRWKRAGAEDSVDPQKFYNYWKSLNVQTVKPKPTYVIWAMIKNYLRFWDKPDKSDMYYLPVDSDGTQWPKDHQPPQVSTAIVQEAQAAIDDIKSTMGMWNPSLGVSEQSLSGKAIGKLQMAGDKGNMEYVNALVQALTFTGDIILDMAPHVLDTPREIPVLGFDNTPGMLAINQEKQTPDGMMVENDMRSGKYRSVVDVGPSFTTQRQEALDAMVAISQGNPQIAAVLAPFMAKFGDWPYAEKIFEILKAIQPPNIQALYDDQEEGGEDPKIAQLKQAFEAQMQEMAAQLEQVGVTAQQQQQVIAELQATVAGKQEELGRMKADFELAKRENKIAADEARLKGQGADLKRLENVIGQLASVVQSMDNGLAKHIKGQAPKPGQGGNGQ